MITIDLMERASAPAARAAGLLSILPQLVIGLLLAAGVRVEAATFPNLYTVVVTLEAGTTQSREEIERRAMATLLTRVTGRRDAAFDPALRRLIDGAGSTYQTGFGETLSSGSFQVQFNATAVQRVLSEASYPIWGPERPLTIVWVAIDGGLGDRALLGAGNLGTEPASELAAMMEEIRTELMLTAYERGLPLALPLLDLEDMIAVDFADVWGGFGERIEQASRRYEADAILLGRAWSTEFGTQVQWTLLKDGQRHFINGTAPRDGLDRAADLYAGEHSTIGDVRRARIRITGVGTLGDYGRVMRYLEGSSLLERVDVDAHENGVLYLSVSARGDAGVLERVLSLGGVLTPARSSAGAMGDSALAFEVVRQGGGG
jgi:uncharacterized protein